jgi:hypothetical protein
MITPTSILTMQTCIQSFLAVNVSANTINLKLAPPNNQTELTGLITRFVSQTSNLTASIKTGMMTVEATYDIYSELCVPPGFSPGGIVEFAIHGYDIISIVSDIFLRPAFL